MGVKAATFQSGGKASQHFLPGGYSRNDFVKGSGGLVSINNGVIAGNSQGGEPNKIYWFGSPTEAEAILIAGPLLDAIKAAFDPGNDMIPSKIGGIRVNSAVKSASAFIKTATTIFNAAAWDNGLHSNQIKRKLEAGTGANTKKITIQYKNQDAYIVDNIKRESFSIQYTGAGSASTMTITLTGLTTTCTGAGADDLDILFSTFTTIEELVNYINDHANYSCSALTGDTSQLSSHLDSVTAQDIKTGAYTAKSDVQALIEAIDACPWVGTVTMDAGATARQMPDNDAAWNYFTGGSDGSYTASEWATTLTALEKEDVQFISTSSTTEAIHLLIKAHVVSMNSVKGKRERQAIVGGAFGETVAQAKTRALNINSNAVALCYPGFKAYDSNGVLQDYAPAYYACKELGRQCVLAINEPATFKSVSVISWEKELSLTELEELIQAGVWAGYKDGKGKLKNARAMTTYQGTDLQQCEFSMMRESLFASIDLRTAIEDAIVGRALTNNVMTDVDGIFQAKMVQYFELGIFNGNPAYWGYNRTVSGDQIIIDYHANLTPPTNFNFITAHLHVYASASAT